MGRRVEYVVVPFMPTLSPGVIVPWVAPLLNDVEDRVGVDQIATLLVPLKRHNFLLRIAVGILAEK